MMKSVAQTVESAPICRDKPLYADWTVCATWPAFFSTWIRPSRSGFAFLLLGVVDLLDEVDKVDFTRRGSVFCPLRPQSPQNSQSPRLAHRTPVSIAESRFKGSVVGSGRVFNICAESEFGVTGPFDEFAGGIGGKP